MLTWIVLGKKFHFLLPSPKIYILDSNTKPQEQQLKMALVPGKISEAAKITDIIPLPVYQLGLVERHSEKIHSISPSHKPTICTIDNK